MRESGFDRTPFLRLASRAPPLPGFLNTPFAIARARLIWGRRLAWIGRGCLIVFAGVALISANREAGLLTLGALAQIRSAVRGGVQMGLAYQLLPPGTLLWLSGRWLLRRARTRPRHWS